MREITSKADGSLMRDEESWNMSEMKSLTMFAP